MLQQFWSVQTQISQDRGKNRTGKTKTQAEEGQLTESKRWMVRLREKKTPLLSRWRLVSFITQSIPRDKAHWIGWGLNRVVQLWDNLGHERISWELHSTSELRQAIRKCHFTLVDGKLRHSTLVRAFRCIININSATNNKWHHNESYGPWWRL